MSTSNTPKSSNDSPADSGAAGPAVQAPKAGETPAPLKDAPAPPKAEGSSFRDTCNLPKTSFPMKANLVQNEPASQKRWDTLGGAGVYALLRQARASQPRFVFHDGPPYANGSIHLGHLMNKCLKDFVVRSQGMMGKDVPYVPGWDCHGLPIEHKVMTDLLEKGKLTKLEALAPDARRMAVRRECQASAEKFVKLQSGQMQRLLTLANYADPYLTMRKDYEGAVLEVLAALCERGLVYRALKPVHWSVANHTALAEAELEYYDRVDPSVYVDFESMDGAAVYDAFGLKEDENSEEDGGEEENDGDEESDRGGESTRAAPRSGTRLHVRPSFMIWTTTPWTLPANLAIAVNPKFTYALVWVDGAVSVMAEGLVEKVTKMAGAAEVVVLAKTTGDRLVGLRYRHPFMEMTKSEGTSGAGGSPAAGSGGTGVSTVSSPVYSVVPADYVTLEDGTGLVHTAPGHGVEDYQTGLRVGLPIYCPVREDGTYDETVPAWLRTPGADGKRPDVWKANDLVVQHLRDSGHLFHHFQFSHSYPHDWRGKSPTIFRATEQWFVGVDRDAQGLHGSLRAMALDSTREGHRETVEFVPEWGRNRLRGMLESRPDWCISRQRAWGLPIPAFVFKDASGREHTLMTPASVRAVAKVVREKGSDVWFQGTPAELLTKYDTTVDPDLSPDLQAALGRAGSQDRSQAVAALTKGPDILDVWFESGSSWNAVMRERSGGRDFPVDLYLEGSDQHRGWFQTSLLPALGMMGRPPFKTLLTHGFMVDKDGKKMSKSLGNTLEVEDLMKEYGADVARWWVSSLAFENDVKVDKSYLDVAGESYRKVRNTLRFMLSNLYDYQHTHADHVAPPPLGELDAWALGELQRVQEQCVAGYAAYDFRRVHNTLYDYCNDTLSAIYLAAVKDRLYCDRPDSLRRRGTQRTLYVITDALCRLLAPIMPHTADEAFLSLRGQGGAGQACVHLEAFAVLPALSGLKPRERYQALLEVRHHALQAMEHARKTLGVENPLDMGVTLPNRDGALDGFVELDLADLLGVSRVRFDPGLSEARVADLRSEPRCERSWRRDGTVRPRAEHAGAMLCERCAEALRR